ncbi:MAG TPA: SDR family oxidoreductase [Spirochaetia bacterium]|nr:SDR family oxidoreductase [Spirochaetia bacterium]
MEESLKGVCVLITGASRGIGKAIALELAKHGARLSLVARDAEALEGVGRSAAEAGSEAIGIPADLTHPGGIDAVVTQTVDHFGGIDVLINNAGAALAKPFAETSESDWQLLMGLNAQVPYFLIQRALPYLRVSSVRTIINVSSVVGRTGYPGQSAYGASKHALIGLSKALARELHPDGIRVHVIAPGSTDTEMITAVRPDLEPEKLISPEEIAETVAFLLTHRGNGMIDEINIRRATGTPWQ